MLILMYYDKDNILINFKKKVLKKLRKDNFVVFFYLFGCTSVFLSCQILKNSPYIENNMNNYYKCVNLLNKYIIKKDVIRICRDLDNQENFQAFVYNLFYTWLLLYSLIREVINNFHFPITYWICAHFSAIIFSLIGNLNSFKFSIDSKSHFSPLQENVLIFLGGFFGLLCFYQIYKNKVNFDIILKFLLVFFTIYILFFTISSNIIFHFHHALISGFFSLFFTNFESKISLYLHSILIGIVINGFNFYSLQEIMMFYISDIVPPNLSYLTIVYILFLILWFFLLFIRKYFCKNKEKNVNNINNDDLGFRLIPDIELIVN